MLSTTRRPAQFWSSTMRIPFAADSLFSVRHQLLGELAEHDVPPDAGYDVAVVLAELVGNALKHARPLPDGGLRLRWSLRSDTVQVSVTDGGGATRPQVRHPDLSATGGRGLSIVDALAADWGVEYEGSTTTVWARVELESERPPQQVAD